MNSFVASFFKHHFGLLAVLLNILNILDSSLTMYWVSNNIAEEANPLMDYLISQSPWLFVSTKIVLVGLGTCLLYRYRESRASWSALACCLAVYLWIMIIHFGIGVEYLSLLSQSD